MLALRPILDAIADNPADSGLLHLARLVDHLRPRRLEPPGSPTARLRALVTVLRTHPGLCQALREHLSAVLAARSQRMLFADFGILPSEGLWPTIRERLIAKLIPPATDERFLGDALALVFDAPGDADWVADIPDALWQELIDALLHEGATDLPGFRKTRIEQREALRTLSYRLANIGLEPSLLRYFPDLTEYESPFVAQNAEANRLLDEETGGDWRHLEVLLGQCEDALLKVRALSREAGAAVGLSYLQRRAEQIIARMRTVASLLWPAGDARGKGVAFFRAVLCEQSERASVRPVLHGLTDLLALQVTEHASKTGEHYVTADRGGYARMFRAAAGAGVIVGFMALLKIFITALHLPPLWAAVGYSLNYGLGFVLIHVLHLTIATKQPAMTAALLAAHLDDRRGASAGLERVAEITEQVCRTQIVAIAGNVLLGIASALAIVGFWRLWGPEVPVDPAKAAGLLRDIHPLASLAIPHAAIAGVCLFMAGLISGYYDNKAIYNRIPQRLQRVRLLRRVLGPARLARLTAYIERNLGALAGNFLFGCMLGCMGTLGFILGLPLDIRHVTFAAANLAYGWAGLDFVLDLRLLAWSALGVAAIGATNLVVSFGLALTVALRSRGVRVGERARLWSLIGQRFRSRPLAFLWPPRSV